MPPTPPTKNTGPVPAITPPASPPTVTVAVPQPTAQQQAQKAMFESALKNVQVDKGTDGDVLTGQPNQRPSNLPAGVPWESGHVQQPTQHQSPAAPANPWDDAATIAHRSMLADEERRLAAMRAKNPMPQIPDITSMPSSFVSGAQKRDLVVKEGADPLLVEAYDCLSTLVAGGLISPAYDKRKVLSTMQRIEGAIQYVPASLVTPPTGEEKKA